jgi:hypothetical protein
MHFSEFTSRKAERPRIIALDTYKLKTYQHE